VIIIKKKELQKIPLRADYSTIWKPEELDGFTVVTDSSYKLTIVSIANWSRMKVQSRNF
jgi:hypothetical protein